MFEKNSRTPGTDIVFRKQYVKSPHGIGSSQSLWINTMCNPIDGNYFNSDDVPNESSFFGVSANNLFMFALHSA